MNYTLNFIIREDLKNKKGTCPIYLRYTYNRKWKNLPLNFSIEPEFWNDSSINKKHPQYNELKTLMYQMENNIRTHIHQYYIHQNNYPSPEILIGLLNKTPTLNPEVNTLWVTDLFEDFVVHKTKDHMKQSTLDIYRYTKEKWLSFESSTYRRELSDMTEKTLSHFIIFLKDQELQKNTIGKYIKTLKTFLKFTSNNLELKVPKSYKRIKTDKEDKYDFQVLTREEFEKLKKEVFYSRYFKTNEHELTEREILIGRIMVFLCSTGLSYVDFDRLTIHDLFIYRDELNPERKCVNIKMNRQKLNTTEVCIIPIIDITIDLLVDMLGLSYKLYNGDRTHVDFEYKMKVLEDLLNSMKSGKVMTPYQPRIFPKVISQKFNVEIKKLLVKIGIDEPVKVISIVNGKSIVKYAPKGDLISSHTGRRTYITLCLQQGISPHILMKTTGHRKISTLLKYNKETEININDEFFKKINTSGK